VPNTVTVCPRSIPASTCDERSSLRVGRLGSCSGQAGVQMGADLLALTAAERIPLLLLPDLLDRIPATCAWTPGPPLAEVTAERHPATHGERVLQKRSSDLPDRPGVGKSRDRTCLPARNVGPVNAVSRTTPRVGPAGWEPPAGHGRDIGSPVQEPAGVVE